MTTWAYDRAYQLLNEHRSGGPANTSFNVTHAYDPAGNRTLVNDGTTLTSFTYSPANRLTRADAGGTLTTYTYDLAGNRTAEQPQGGSSTLYAWDAAGRMVSADAEAGIVTLSYNADGQRTAKQGTDGSVVGFLYDGKRLLHETDEVGGEVTHSYAAGTSDEYGDLIGGGSEPIHQYDAQANTAALLDDWGQVEAQYKYGAFGEVAAVSVEGGAWSAVDWPTLQSELSSHMLAGGRKQYYLDPETELYLLGGGTNGRYYDPATARFLSEDPIRQQSSDPANLFAFVHNDPVNRLDPSGHDDQDKRKEQEKQQAGGGVWQQFKEINKRIFDADKRAASDILHGRFGRIKHDMQEALNPPPPPPPTAGQQPKTPPAAPTAQPAAGAAADASKKPNAPAQGNQPQGKSGGPSPHLPPQGPAPGGDRLSGAMRSVGIAPKKGRGPKSHVVLDFTGRSSAIEARKRNRFAFQYNVMVLDTARKPRRSLAEENGS